MSKNSPEPESSGGRAKVEWNLSSYATKADLQNPIDSDTSKFAKKG